MEEMWNFKSSQKSATSMSPNTATQPSSSFLFMVSGGDFLINKYM